MTSTAIKGEFIVRIKADDALKLKIAEANSVRITSIDRWLREPNVILTTYDNLEILKEHFGLQDVGELLEEKESIKEETAN